MEKRLLATRDKIRNKRRELTGGVVEDKVKELGKRTYEELEEDLDALYMAAIEGKGKASEAGHKLFDEVLHLLEPSTDLGHLHEEAVGYVDAELHILHILPVLRILVAQGKVNVMDIEPDGVQVGEYESTELLDLLSRHAMTPVPAQVRVKI